MRMAVRAGLCYNYPMRDKDRPNLNEKAYGFVMRLLSSGELKPGHKLSEPSLASACGVSRTPMREAVRRLVEEGVLYQIDKTGTFVAGFGVKEVRDAYEIRRAIESATLTRAVRHLSARHLAALKNDCDRMHAAIRLMRKCGMAIMTGRAEREFLKSDLSFHMRLLKVSGNELAEKIIANAYRRNQFFGTHSHQRTLRHVALAWRFHCEILRCCRAKDAAGAVHWLSCHLERSEQDALLPIGRS